MKLDFKRFARSFLNGMKQFAWVRFYSASHLNDALNENDRQNESEII